MVKRKINKPYKKVERIDVFIWDQFVGAVSLDPKLGYYVFAYDPKFGKSRVELSPLQMPANDREELFVFPELPELTFKRLPAMLADALPDDFGNALIDRYMAEKGILRSQVTALDRLAYMGHRSMGALEFKPSRGPKSRIPTALEMNQLVSEARNLMKGAIAPDDEAHAILRAMIDVGTSAGGARAKAVIAWNPQTGEICSGQVPAPDGFEHWLLKFDGVGSDQELGVSQDYGRVEFAYFLMARFAGISISNSRLLEENGRAHFMTKRFDRDQGSIKHHLQTLCAMNHLDYKKKSTNSYEQLFLTIRELKLGHDADVEAYRRMIFNVMGRNCDDHTKNTSFRLKQHSSWELAPAYDITFAHNPNGEFTHQHLMSINGKFKNITMNDLLVIADKFGVGEAPSIIAAVRKAIKDWHRFAHQAKVSARVIERIQSQHLTFE